MSKRNDRLNPVHPGDVLREDFMKPMKLSAYAVAKAIGATPIGISQICRGKRSVSAEMALKLGRLFNVSPELWMGIQADYDWKSRGCIAGSGLCATFIRWRNWNPPRREFVRAKHWRPYRESNPGYHRERVVS